MTAPKFKPDGTIASRSEVLGYLTGAAKRGNVPAMRLLLEELRRDDVPESEIASVVDQLAAKRAKTATIG